MAEAIPMWGSLCVCCCWLIWTYVVPNLRIIGLWLGLSFGMQAKIHNFVKNFLHLGIRHEINFSHSALDLRNFCRKFVENFCIS